MKKKVYVKKLCYSTIAMLALFMLCTHLHALNKTDVEGQEVRVGLSAPALMGVSTDGLKGTWMIDQVTIQKTINDVKSEKTYSLKQRQKIESFADCPKAITFRLDGKVLFEYNEKDSSEDSYTVEGNQITRKTPVAGYTYHYSITDANKIQLRYSVEYVRNSGNNTDHIKEEYTFFGTKK